jgi:hypothetical protein
MEMTQDPVHWWRLVSAALELGYTGQEFQYCHSGKVYVLYGTKLVIPCVGNLCM